MLSKLYVRELKDNLKELIQVWEILRDNQGLDNNQATKILFTKIKKLEITIWLIEQ